MSDQQRPRIRQPPENQANDGHSPKYAEGCRVTQCWRTRRRNHGHPGRRLRCGSARSVSSASFRGPLSSYNHRASWQKQVVKPKGLTAAEVRERPPTDSSLVDPLDKKLLRDAVRTPCCDTAYSEENIQTHLLEYDFTCPTCGKNIQSLDKLVADKPLRLQVIDYIEKAVEESRKLEGETEESSVSVPADDEPGEEGQVCSLPLTCTCSHYSRFFSRSKAKKLHSCLVSKRCRLS